MRIVKYVAILLLLSANAHAEPLFKATPIVNTINPGAPTFSSVEIVAKDTFDIHCFDFQGNRKDSDFSFYALSVFDPS